MVRSGAATPFPRYSLRSMSSVGQVAMWLSVVSLHSSSMRRHLGGNKGQRRRSSGWLTKEGAAWYFVQDVSPKRFILVPLRLVVMFPSPSDYVCRLACPLFVPIRLGSSSQLVSAGAPVAHVERASKAGQRDQRGVGTERVGPLGKEGGADETKEGFW